jgi:hypothetical protein
MTMPSFAKIPTQVPALLIASMAYSTCVDEIVTGEKRENG